MRLIDAEPIEKFIENGLNKKNPVRRFGHDAIEILTEIHYAPTISLSTPPNPPLTLEELREMARSGLAVWCVDADGIAQGLLCMRENWSDSRIAPHIWMLDDECNSGVYSVGYMLELGAKFYRRKPEEGTVA